MKVIFKGLFILFMLFAASAANAEKLTDDNLNTFLLTNTFAKRQK